jgi:hypothetical protein
MIFRAFGFACIALALAAIPLAAKQPYRLSTDRELKAIDLTNWDCLNKPEGSAKTADGLERNRVKNRSMPEGGIPAAEQTETAGFLRRLAEFEAKTKGLKRDALNPEQRKLLEPLEKKIVTMTGYLGLAYAGGTETCNCASLDFHDWHLEIFEKPIEHPPQPGDPTPIICEITPRTQNAIFRDGFRVQEATAFFRRIDMSYEATGHKAQRVRITGYLLWDDEHNATADVGPTINGLTANKLHHPWRTVAWEIHPVFRIERADGASVSSAPEATPAAGSPPSATPETSAAPLTKPAATALPAVAMATPQQVVTVLQPIKIRIQYGETVLPRGTQLPVVAHDAQSVTVQYMGKNQVIPISSTDFH